MDKFNAQIKSLGVLKVGGKLTKLKGYSKLKFFSHKVNKTWYIREFHTGRRLGNGTTEARAKRASRVYLKEYSNKQIEGQIESLEQINGKDNEETEKERIQN